MKARKFAVIKPTMSEEFSVMEIVLLLLLSSRSNTKERKMPDPCLWDDGIEQFDPRPMKDDCNIYQGQCKT